MTHTSPTTRALAPQTWGAIQVEPWAVIGEDGGETRLFRVATSGTPRARVLMLPGMFTARHFWLSPKGVGLAAYLAEQGLECWLFERRGLGEAPKASTRSGMAEACYVDLPAVQRLIAGQPGAPPLFIVGHSFGGVLGARALAESLDADGVAGLVLFAAQCETGKNALRPPGGWLVIALSKLLGRLPAKMAGLGPEDEPADAAIDAVRWTTAAQRNGRWLEVMRGITTPVLAIASAGDSVDPAEGCERLYARFASVDRSWTLLSKANGWAEDYSHPGMIVSRAAREEVWPHVGDWISTRCG
jgi:predicted alpha/beta hydrolase